MGWDIEVSKRHFDFQSRCVSSTFVVQKRREACEFHRLQRAITALCTPAMLCVIFHNHRNPTTLPPPHPAPTSIYR